MLSSRRTSVLVAIACHAFAANAFTATGLSAEKLVGTWLGQPAHNGQTGEFLLHFSDGSSGNLKVSVSMPAIDVSKLELGEARIVGGKIRLRGMELDWTEDDETLRGTLPASLVPVHEIVVTLHHVPDTPATVLSKEISAPGIEPAWTFDTGAPVWAAPLYAGGRVYVGNDRGTLYALDASTGDLVWSFETAGAIRARPSLDGDLLYVPSDDGHLYRLTRGGTERDRIPLHAVERDPAGYDHFQSSAVIYGGSVLIGSADGKLHCFDVDTGAERWSFETRGAVRGTPLIEDGAVFFGSFDGRVYSVGVESGELIWKHDTGAPVVSSPAFHEGRIIIGSRSYDLLALDVVTGAVDWTYYYWFSWIESSASIRDDVVYIGASDSQKLNALNARTGRLVWAFDTGGSDWGQPAVTEDSVFIGTVGVADYITDHQAGFLAVDRATGEAWGRFAVDPPSGAARWGFGSSPVVGEGRVFIGGLDGLVYAFPIRR